MATLYISEFATCVVDGRGQPVAAPEYPTIVPDSVVSITAGSLKAVPAVVMCSIGWKRKRSGRRADTGLLGPWQIKDLIHWLFWQPGCLPDLHGTVQASRGNPFSVRAERHAHHPAPMAAEGANLRGRPPQASPRTTSSRRSRTTRRRASPTMARCRPISRSSSRRASTGPTTSIRS